MLSFIALFTVPPHLRLPLSRKTREQVAIYSRPQLFRRLATLAGRRFQNFQWICSNSRNFYSRFVWI